MGAVRGGRQVTPEGVLLDVEPAGLGSRGVAFAVDVIIQGVVLVVVLVAGALLGWGTAGVVAALLTTLVLLFGYPLAFEAGRRGQTPGKRVARLRVQSVDGAPPTVAQAAVRSALGLVDLWLSFGSVAVISYLVTARGQRLGDLAAGTVVVAEPRGGQVVAARFEAPPELRWLTDRVDVSGLAPDDYRAVRQLLLRVDDLPSDAADRLARRVADGVAARTGEPVPDGSSPVGYLRAVAEAVQRRSPGTAAADVARPDGPPRPGGQ